MTEQRRVGDGNSSQTHDCGPDALLLPGSAELIEAITAEETINPESSGLILAVAQRLARSHLKQWTAEDACRGPRAADHVIAGFKRAIDALNAERVVMVEQIDVWLARCLRGPEDAPLHTETLGSVIDRLAVAWVRARRLGDTRDPADVTSRSLGRRALRQLAEQADSYDDLVRDLRFGRRRMPCWSALKRYGGDAEQPGGVTASVSLNGADNVGKSTHLRWLARAIPGASLVGTIDRWDARWERLAAGDFARWWFVESTTSEHVEIVLGSHQARRRGSGPLALEDRGRPMLVATCAATAVVKDGIAPEEALTLVEALGVTYPAGGRCEVSVLLRHADEGPSREAALAVAREPRAASIWYAEYQRQLAVILDLQARRGGYDLVVVRGNRPLLAVQREIRKGLAGLGVPVEPLPPDRIERFWVLGGLSESGKSTVGELLRVEHGAARLKIGYLLEAAADRNHVSDPYAEWDEQQQAEILTEELLRYAHRNPGASRLSLESAHRYDATAHLKRIWGLRCHVVYLDAAPASRVGRSEESADSIASRDEVKRRRGADRIADIADWTIDNSGGLAELKLAVAYLSSATIARDTPAARSPTGRAPPKLRRWLDDVIPSLVDPQVAAILVTGSHADASWRPGWSDLDLVVIRDELPVAWLQAKLGTIPAPEDVNVGISAFTTEEVATLRVPPRIVHALRLLASNGCGVRYLRQGETLPSPDSRADDQASRGELALVVMTLRRLITSTPMDIRAVHKHVTLVMKILLRADGVRAESSGEVLHAFRTAHPAAAVGLPQVDEVLAVDWRTDPEITSRVTAAAAAVLHYYETLGQSLRPGCGNGIHPSPTPQAQKVPEGCLYQARHVARLNVAEGVRTVRVVHTLDGIEAEVWPETLLANGRALWQRWQAHPQFRPHQVILGLDAGGILPTVALSLASLKPYRLAWKLDLDLPDKLAFCEPNASRTEVFAYGALSGQRVLIVDDEVTTGRTIASLIGVLRDGGADVVGVTCLVEDTSGEGRALLTSMGVPLCALATL